MKAKTAKAKLTPVRQRTQYTCMATSLMMALQAQGVKCTEDEVNDVMGARPMRGASWEQALAAAQHYGCRATLMAPCTVEHLKKLTDDGVAVLIAWNPEGRDWSHASVVFDVTADGKVYVADPNIPDPDETVRVMERKEFYSKWYEKWPDYLVRRPAMAIEREITKEGKQVPVRTASVEHMNPNIPALYMVDGGAMVSRAFVDISRRASRNKTAATHFSFQAKNGGEFFVPLKGQGDMKRLAKLASQMGAQFVAAKKKQKVPSGPPNLPGKGLAERGGTGGGTHHTRDHDVAKGRSRKPKHKKDWESREANYGLKFAHSGLSYYFDMNLVPYQSWNFIASDGTPVEFSNRAVLAYLSKADLKHQNRVANDLLQIAMRRGDPNEYLEKLASRLVEAAAKKEALWPFHKQDATTPMTFKMLQAHMAMISDSMAQFIKERNRPKRTGKGFFVGDMLFEPVSGGQWKVEVEPGKGMILLSFLRSIPGATERRSHLGGYQGNPDGDDIYPNDIEHGYDEPVAGGTDVMRRLQNQLLHEQGNDDWKRPGSPQHPKKARSSFDREPQSDAVALAKKWIAKNQGD